MIRAYLALAAFAIGAIAAAFGGHTYGVAATRVEYLSVQNSDLRESRKEIERQVAHVTQAQKVYDEQVQKTNESERKYRAADRLRQRAVRAAAIATASAKTCRVYATQVTDLYEACRAEYIDLGHEAERLRAATEALSK